MVLHARFNAKSQSIVYKITLQCLIPSKVENTCYVRRLSELQLMRNGA